MLKALLALAAALPTIALAAPELSVPQLTGLSSTGAVIVSQEGQRTQLKVGQKTGPWTLMAVVPDGANHKLAVLEDFSQLKGRILFVDEKGMQVELPKSLEPTFADPGTLYRGHSLEDVFKSDRDLLADELLARPGDPQYAEVAACFPPISKMPVYTFVGTHECLEKVGIFYGGATPNFDPIAYVPAIEKIRNEGRVWDGLVGGWLPAVRFVYPEKEGDWSELVAYAPMRVENGNARVQPVWYRLSRIEGNVLRWVRYFDSYHPFPPRMEASAEAFYQDLIQMRDGWDKALAPGMQIEIPDSQLANMARHSLVRDMITRMGAFPKYGVFDRGYGGSEHDGFPDTFTADTTAMLEWGLFDLARQYLDNYFTFFVRDDGSILYRGPETGQFGRMLTIAAQYANYTGDYQLLLRHGPRLDAITKLLLSLRTQSLSLPAENPARGMIAGWSEADACLDPDPPRYMQPYFSNSTEAERGFGELGTVWERIGRKNNQPELVSWGQKLRHESVTLGEDIQQAISRSMLTNIQPRCLPAIAGVKEPFHLAVQRDKLDPQFRSYRAFMEMLYSGNLNREQVETIVSYRAAHRDLILGVPTCYGYNTHELAGFLSYGHAYGLLQHDFIRQYLLTLYTLMAHQYTRGTWTAPETRLLDPKRPAAPYCTPAQMVVPLLTRWMLVFEDPASGELWLAKGTPREWLEDGKRISVSSAPTRWGRLGFTIESGMSAHRIEAKLYLPAAASTATVRLRLRAPEGNRIRSVLLGGQPWNQFDADQETITLPAGAKGKLELIISYP